MVENVLFSPMKVLLHSLAYKDEGKQLTRNTLLTLCLLVCTLAVQAQSWLNTLRNDPIIDSVVVVASDKGWADYLNMQSFHIYYHQPLSHQEPDGEQFQLRATLVVRKNKSLVTTPMQVFISGYDIHEYNWDNPSYYVGEGSANSDYFEIANHLKANVLSVEHRYFDGSMPAKANQRMEYCTAEEAAADFHALIEATKKVFRGKYVISGISKGGTTTFLQHALFPDDADLYVPYVAPLCDTPNDARTMQYYKANAWDEELRHRINAIQREMLTNPDIYKQASEWTEYYNPSWSTLQHKQKFLYNVGILDFEPHMHLSRDEARDLLDKIDSMKALLMKHGYPESYLWANMAFQGLLDPEACWQWLLDTPDTRAVGRCSVPPNRQEYKVPLPFTISSKDFDKTITGYYYQAAHELGNFGFDFHTVLDEDGYAVLADSLNTVWTQSGNHSLKLNMPYLKTVTYDPTLRNKVVECTRQATKPIIFLFGGDDAWTGGALPDECYNNETTFRLILPNQNHGASISQASFADRSQAWSLIDDALAGKLTNGINRGTPAPHHDTLYNLSGQRISTVQHGQLYIQHGKLYRK